ncbi:MAG: endonuclease/exonuclease/phosphatase family protein [Cyanobacteria bacterium P01_F01_bin.150]
MFSERAIKTAPLLPKWSTPGRYDAHDKHWKAIATDAGRSQSINSQPTFTIATLNVWFANYYFEERCKATLGLLEAHRPDIITLQEVTPEFLHATLQAPWVQAEYQVSDIRWSSVDPYGVLILSRHHQDGKQRQLRFWGQSLFTQIPLIFFHLIILA